MRRMNPPKKPPPRRSLDQDARNVLSHLPQQEQVALLMAELAKPGLTPQKRAWLQAELQSRQRGAQA